MPRKKQEEKVSTAKPVRKKVRLKVTPQDAANDVAKSLTKKGVNQVMVFGQDEYTDEVLASLMKAGMGSIRFSDNNVHKASHMQKVLARFNNSLLVGEHIHHTTALGEVWAEVIIFGLKETAKQYKEIVGELPYKNIIVLEEV